MASIVFPFPRRPEPAASSPSLRRKLWAVPLMASLLFVAGVLALGLTTESLEDAQRAAQQLDR